MLKYFIILITSIISLFSNVGDKSQDSYHQENSKEAIEDSLTVFLEGYSFEKADGTIFSFEEVKGKVLLLDFWGTWCRPCIKEHPVVEKLVSSINNPDLQLINVAVERDKKKWTNFMKEHLWKGINITVGFDHENPLYKMTSGTMKRKNGDTVFTTSVPRYYLIDKSLHVEEIKDLNEKGLKEKILKMLAL